MTVAGYIAQGVALLRPWATEPFRPNGLTRDRNDHPYIERVFLSFSTELSPLRGYGNTRPRHFYRALVPVGTCGKRNPKL